MSAPTSSEPSAGDASMVASLHFCRARGVTGWEVDAVMHRELSVLAMEQAQPLCGPPSQTHSDGGNGFAEEKKHVCDVLVERLFHFFFFYILFIYLYF